VEYEAAGPASAVILQLQQGAVVEELEGAGAARRQTLYLSLTNPRNRLAAEGIEQATAWRQQVVGRRDPEQ